MSRPLRLEFEGALYHLTARGDRREPIFVDDADRQALLNVLALGLDRFDAEAFAYCLMGNHYHFVVQTRRPNLSRLMRHVNGVYTQYFNRRHRKAGHLFQGRFKAILVDRDAYFLAVCRYVDLNPVRAALVARAQDWPWSSYRAHAGAADGPPWLNSGELHLRLAPQAPQRQGPAAYARYVGAGRDAALWTEALVGQIYLGSAEFGARMQAKFGRAVSAEVPRAQRRRPAVRPLESFRAGADRDAGILLAYREGGYTQTAIATATGLSVSRVSRVIAALECGAKGGP
ncbi:MAG: REP-associated tyrosine transposase [Betaproteobacteria bacterium]